jgi:hypothetical protein
MKKRKKKRSQWQRKKKGCLLSTFTYKNRYIFFVSRKERWRKRQEETKTHSE